jgi:hypothetical protein
MITLVRGAALAAAVIGAPLALAVPASADPTPGPYTGTILQAEQYNVGDTAPFTVDSCGPDCVHVVQTGAGWQMHRQGNIWTESDQRGSATLDGNSLVLTVDSVEDGHVVIGLVKNA